MQNIPLWLVLWQWCGALLSVGMAAAAALPLITALTLLIGRRGNARLCAFGATQLARLGYGLAWLGLPVLGGGIAVLMFAARGPGNTPALISLWAPAMLPFTITALLWLAGLCCAGLLKRACVGAPLPPRRPEEEDHYATAVVKNRLLLCLSAAACFFAGYLTRNWPFAALPAGLTVQQVLSAILSDATHKYFMAFAPAGALALLFLLRLRHSFASGLGPESRERAARWCALWAMIGYIPFCLDRWGLVIGYALRGGGLPGWLLPQIAPLALLTAAVVCWSALFATSRPLRRSPLIVLGLLLLLARESLPYVQLLMAHGR